MSRSAVPKSRSEKSRSSALPVITPLVTVVDIVPGRLTDSEWQSLAMSEEGESNVMDIIDDLVGLALEQVYSIYIEEQLLPFTIAQAKEAILQIIEWRFLNHDGGESNVALDHSWQEDREPTTTGTDCWAQGSVPLMPEALSGTDTQDSRQDSWGEIPGPGMEGQSGIRVASPAGQGAECGAQPPAMGSQDTSLCRWLMGIDLDEEQEETETEETETEESSTALAPAPLNRPQHEPQEAEVPAEASTARREISRPQGKGCQLRSRKQQKVPRPVVRVQSGLRQRAAEVSRSVSREELEVPSEMAPSPCATFWMPRCVQAMLKSQRTRLPSSNAVTFDQFGNISAVQRLEAGRFRWYRPAPAFQLLEGAPGRGRCRQSCDPPLRRMVFRGRPLPPRPRTGRGTGMPEGAAGKPPSAGVTVGQRPTLPQPRHSPDFPEFIPDGLKDRNHPRCGRHPQWEASSLGQLQPISCSLVLPPIALEELALGLLL